MTAPPVAAHDALRALEVLPVKTVLASGGVGSIAVPLAKAACATVIVTARRGLEADYVTGVGAAHTVG